MKSQVIKVKNLKEWASPPKQIRVKPNGFLTVVGIAGVAMMFLKTYLAGLGLCVVTVSVFALLLLPDRILVEFTPQYIVMYNQKDEEMCTIIYYDEILEWHYEWHATCDKFAITLIDGTSESVDMYSKRCVLRSMHMYAPGKERK